MQPRFSHRADTNRDDGNAWDLYHIPLLVSLSRPNDSQAQVTEIFTSLTSILKKAGSDLNHLVKATYYVSDDKSSTSLNELRPKYYDPKRPPAASKAMVKAVGLMGKGISVDMIGVVADNRN